ncbi:hypothetical protein FUAX_29440 [Fulvitalea axinellae]|uniref:Substrate import-associated zinc metallohydrolase lipoprotein n=1 Tax=Fulvitalea axinellae TaxID=1182444 RepID=A0AAU9CRA3_9BACT|nr:hypothetical protein FUAX_29440 [Fulvitalea axinellae]
MLNTIKKSALALALGLTLWSCEKEDSLTLDPLSEQEKPATELDQYLHDNFQKPHNCIVRYKFVNRYVDDTKRVTPADRDMVKPYMDFVKDYWISPYTEEVNSENLIKKLFPSELVLIGSSIFNADGSRTLGTADAGVRITLTNVNDMNLASTNWIAGQLHTMQHEFTHIVHQRYDLPDGYQKLSEGDYTGASWIIQDHEETLPLGFVTPYASNNPNEDFAELVSHILTMDAQTFSDRYLDITKDENGQAPAEGSSVSLAVIEGKLLIKQKYDMTFKYFQEELNIDLGTLRDRALGKIYAPKEPEAPATE